MKGIILIIAVSLFFSGCGNSPTGSSQDSYLVFGWFYSECMGEACVEVFKIENEKVYEDTLDNYPTGNNLPLRTGYRLLSGKAYEKVKQLPALIPDKLFLENAVVIGQPDAGDWGGFYVETNQSGTTRYWLIDKKQSNLPEYLHALADSLDQAINALQ